MQTAEYTTTEMKALDAIGRKEADARTPRYYTEVVLRG